MHLFFHILLLLSFCHSFLESVSFAQESLLCNHPDSVQIWSLIVKPENKMQDIIPLYTNLKYCLIFDSSFDSFLNFYLLGKIWLSRVFKDSESRSKRKENLKARGYELNVSMLHTAGFSAIFLRQFITPHPKWWLLWCSLRPVTI